MDTSSVQQFLLWFFWHIKNSDQRSQEHRAPLANVLRLWDKTRVLNAPRVGKQVFHNKSTPILQSRKFLDPSCIVHQGSSSISISLRKGNLLGCFRQSTKETFLTIQATTLNSESWLMGPYQWIQPNLTLFLPPLHHTLKIHSHMYSPSSYLYNAKADNLLEGSTPPPESLFISPFGVCRIITREANYRFFQQM